MINIVKKKLEFDDELKKKIEFICGFCNTIPTIINGNMRDYTDLLHLIILNNLENTNAKLIRMNIKQSDRLI